VDNVHVVWAARGGSSSYKTLFFRAIFEGSWCPRLDEVACVPRFMKVWRWRPFFLPPLLLSSHLDFHIDPLKIQEQPFNLLVLQIWSLTFLLWFFFLSWIIYWIWTLILLIYIFFAWNHFFNWFYFTISSFFSLYLIHFLLIVNFLALTSFYFKSEIILFYDSTLYCFFYQI